MTATIIFTSRDGKTRLVLRGLGWWAEFIRNGTWVTGAFIGSYTSMPKAVALAEFRKWRKQQ